VRPGPAENPAGFRGLAKRSVFVIDRNGTVTYTLVTVDPAGLPDQVLKSILTRCDRKLSDAGRKIHESIAVQRNSPRRRHVAEQGGSCSLGASVSDS